MIGSSVLNTSTESSNADLILVDERDQVVGYVGKQRAHTSKKFLHRAFSVLIYNPRGEMLLQLRSVKKYHFGGLWSNACCGHPTRGEQTHAAAERRLGEEFGFRVTLQEQFAFVYEAYDEASGLSEHEFDRVYTGLFAGTPRPNREEIDRYRWIDVTELLTDVQRHPDRYTPWFRILLNNPKSLCSGVAGSG